MQDRFGEVLDRLRQTHDKKGEDYGSDGDPYANIRASTKWGVPAWVGALIRASDKVHRLQAFYETGKLSNEGAEDSLLDLSTYAVIAYVLWLQQEDEINKGLCALKFKDARNGVIYPCDQQAGHGGACSFLHGTFVEDTSIAGDKV